MARATPLSLARASRSDCLMKGNILHYRETGETNDTRSARRARHPAPGNSGHLRRACPGHNAACGPLNVPIVLASNFHADADTGQDSRAYSRTDATPGWEALETAVGQVEGGHAVAFASGMAAIAAVLDLVPAGGRIIALEDCYFGVGELLADALAARTLGRGPGGPDRHRRRPRLPSPARTCSGWRPPPTRCSEVADLPALCAAPAHAAGAIVGVRQHLRHATVPQPLALGEDVVRHSATSSSAATPTCSPASPSPASRPWPAPAPPPRPIRRHPRSPWKPSWPARLRTLALRLDRASASAATRPPLDPPHPAISRVRYPGLPGDPDTAPPPRDDRLRSRAGLRGRRRPHRRPLCEPCMSSSTRHQPGRRRKHHRRRSTAPRTDTSPLPAASASAAKHRTTSGTTRSTALQHAPRPGDPA